MIRKSTFICFLLCISVSLLYGQSPGNQSKVEAFIKTKPAEIGVAFHDLTSGQEFTLGNRRHYPMQSVYKFHLALVVMHKIDIGELALEQIVHVTKEELLPNTWSPIRDKFPEGTDLTLGEIIQFTVANSDNNGCDILFRMVGGTDDVEKSIKKLGIKKISIKATEDEMHKDWHAQFANWTTPEAMMQLLISFRQKEILSTSSFEFLWNTMVATTTGPMRLKGKLPEGTVVAHKTGTSGQSNKGVMPAMNDVGIVQLPDGREYVIVVFVSNTKLTYEEGEAIIAEVSKIIWDSYQSSN